jgi:hypothetical protein
VSSYSLRAVNGRLSTSLLVCLDLGQSTLVLNLGSRVSGVHGAQKIPCL